MVKQYGWNGWNNLSWSQPCESFKWNDKAIEAAETHKTVGCVPNLDWLLCPVGLTRQVADMSQARLDGLGLWSVWIQCHLWNSVLNQRSNLW